MDNYKFTDNGIAMYLNQTQINLFKLGKEWLPDLLRRRLMIAIDDDKADSDNGTYGNNEDHKEDDINEY